MTRINLIAPKELTDQHLIAEYRELPRIFGIVRKKIEENKKVIVGEEYKMGKGHVIFFYDKLLFLQKRLSEIIRECERRGFNISFSKDIDISDIPKCYKKDFVPTERDIQISKARIEEKLKSKANFYKYYGKNIDEKSF